MIEKDPLELNADFQYALDLLEKGGRNLFITGRAGTGKSTLLQLFRNTTRKKCVVLAPTGVAALNVGGQTIHSFFRLPAKPLQREEIKQLSPKFRRLYQKIDVLIIDEISMVRADLLDNVDIFLRKNRMNPEPFGGVQVIFFGDLFQLPPVVASEAEKLLFNGFYETPYFFSAQVFYDGFEIETLELKKSYRQESRHFLRLLEAVRLNHIDYDDLEDLNERFDPDFETQEYYITLSTRNAIVNSINDRELRKIEYPAVTYTASIEGSFAPNLYPTDSILNLKLGAQVMFVKNDPQKKFVNGSIGKIVGLDPDKVSVQIETTDGGHKVIEVEKMEWEIQKYKLSEQDPNAIDTQVVGSFKQMPLRLAWAITIHKSQGKTFDKVIIDMGRGAFEHGQTYVALSRCRTLEGIVLKQKLRPQDIMVDHRIVEYYEGNL